MNKLAEHCLRRIPSILSIISCPSPKKDKPARNFSHRISSVVWEICFLFLDLIKPAVSVRNVDCNVNIFYQVILVKQILNENFVIICNLEADLDKKK